MLVQAFRQGHDIQPHVHPQWSKAEYLGDLKWRLSGAWSVLQYPREEMRLMLTMAQKTLQWRADWNACLWFSKTT